MVTSLCLGSGAQRGLLTPVHEHGGHARSARRRGLDVALARLAGGAFALIGAAAMLGASIQAPLAGLVLVVELTHSGLDLMVPIVAAPALASVVARRIDGYSIYSARLPTTNLEK